MEKTPLPEKEINRKIHVKRFGLPPYPSFEEVPDIETYDPCNNLEQAWDAMLHFDVSVTKWAKGYAACTNLGNRYTIWDTENLCCDEIDFDPNPFVAAMLVILKG